ncbi:reverse transcriptase domain-containing protein [Tanacetum coccineum]
MAPKRRTMRLNTETTPAITAATTTTVTNAQGVTAILAARDANTNGVDSQNSGTVARRNERATHECTYPDFMKCQPLNFKGTEGVVDMTQWIEKMEIVFRISNCSVENQIKFSTCTLLGNALTWWNSHELALLCGRMFLVKFTRLRNNVVAYPDMIHGSVVASKPKTMQEATEMAIEVMDKRIRTFADWTVEKKPYGGSKPLCSKCNNNHDGPCAPKCHKCNKVGHFAHDCRNMTSANNANNQRGTGSGQKPTCFECGAQGHFKRGCTLNILNHPFNIDLMPIELGSFDAIIGMDWLVKYQAIIVCAEKIVRIPWGNETLIVHGDGSNQGHEARLHIISYTKTQEYMLKGCPIFLAHVTTKGTEDKSKEKRLEDVPIV